MRHLSTTFLVIFLFIAAIIPAHCAYKGGVSYSIPIEYDNLSENDLKPIANRYFYNALREDDGVVNEDITKALNIYTILQHKNPYKISYFIKTGILYDKLGKERYAKKSFSCAIGIDPSKAVGYYYFGEFYYKRGQYRQALRYYKIALEKLETPDYDLYYKLGDVYQKFGDTKQALKYLKMAESVRSNPSLTSKIGQVQKADSVNILYYND